jgi:hypothetical protein
MGECCSKEWIARIPDADVEEPEALWVLLKVRNLSRAFEETGEENLGFHAELFSSISDVDWLRLHHKRERFLDRMVEQFFTGQRGFWEANGADPLVLMHAAVEAARWTFH